MNSPDRLACSPPELVSLARRWCEQERDLKAAAVSLSTEVGGLPSVVDGGIHQFLTAWSAEIDLRAAEAGELAAGLTGVAGTSVEVDHHWGSIDAWRLPA